MTSVKDSFLDLERHRKLLEQNVEKLRQSLQQWQLWNLEYEALKEEVSSLPKPVERADLARIRRDFDGQVVTKKEVDEIFGRVDVKPAEQIVNVLSRRIDYSTKNVETLEKQLEAAENKLAAATVLTQPDYTHEDGEQVMDIVEQLDDDDNVVSYRVQTPGDIQPQILEALKKAGIKDLPDLNKEPGSERASDENEEDRVKEDDTAQQTAPTSREDAREDTSEPSQVSSPRKKKGVSFAEDTKLGHDDDENNGTPPQSRAAQRLTQIMRTAKEQEDQKSSSAIIPEGESAEDAALRQEMLEYSMSEIGPVVAELSLEDGTDDEDDDIDFDYTDEEEDEDAYGRSNFHVDADYRERMLELQEKLGVKSTFTRGSVPDEGVGRISIVSPDAAKEPEIQQSSLKPEGKTPDTTEKKSVQFAQSLDIAPNGIATLPERPKRQQTEPVKPLVEPLSDIVERTKPAAAPTQNTSRKPSRFKSSRTDNKDTSVSTQEGTTSTPKGPEEAPVRFLDQDIDQRIAPSGPEGQTIADSVLERETTKPREPDEMDAALLHQEAAVEYHRKRNRLIHSQGGFMKEDKSPTVPVEEDEEPKRVSRFKAARLSKQ
ncbi:uncharacterized protein E0L32_009484 [Thyridium curvatum]|uniref:DUF3835 domain-containing protein n=1 Tax=Thyridium curvatum TaxID=1093900 RepID=A0A507AIY4_9PEZI|nr:uncharacterized protein E0L32_009484 [Thyridium curvatum]TPX09292.1 hypothetical protein E0L32_009484 [Thyridium curvatum]